MRFLNTFSVLAFTVMLGMLTGGVVTANNQFPVTGIVVFMSNDLLYYYDFATQDDPQLVSEEPFAVNQSFAVAPDRSYIVLGQWTEENEYKLVKFDIATRELDTIFTHDVTIMSVDSWRENNDPYLYVSSWSPDENWIVASTFDTAMVVPLNNGFEAIEISNVFPYWSTDSRLLMEGSNNWTVLDPASGESSDIPAGDLPNPEDDFAAYQQALEEMFAAEGVTLASQPLPPVHFYASTEFNIDPGAPLRGEYCRDWSIVMQDTTNGESFDIYQTSDAAVIAHVTPVGEAQLLYLQARYDGCETGIPTGELVRLTGDLEPEVLVDGLTSAADDDVQFGFIPSRRFFLSPEETHVLYLSHDRYGLEPNQAMLLDLTTLETQPVEGLTGIDVIEWFAPTPGT